MSNWEELKELGNAEYKKQNYSTAISLYSDAINCNPEQDILYANRALCHKALGNYRQALTDLDKSLNIVPNNVKNLKRKAEVLVICGHIAEAIPYFQKCYNLEPKVYQHTQDLMNANSNLTLLNTLHSSISNEDYVKAEEICNKLNVVCPGSKDIKLAYLDSLMNNNKLSEATSFWSKINDNERSEDEFVYKICQIFYYEGNYERAKTFLKKLLLRVNDNPKYNKLLTIINSIERDKEKANNLFKSGKYEEAITTYGHLLDVDPKNRIFNSTIIANRALCKYNKI